MIPTRFFRFSNNGDCYYALIKGIDSGFALEIYDSNVTMIETKEEKEDVKENMRELSLSDAIEEIRHSVGEDGKSISDTDILEQITDDELYLLAIDASLV